MEFCCCVLRDLHCDANGVGTYLSWIPVVGGGIGVLVGGFLSDRLAKRWGYKARIVILVLSCVSEASLSLSLSLSE